MVALAKQYRYISYHVNSKTFVVQIGSGGDRYKGCSETIDGAVEILRAAGLHDSDIKAKPKPDKSRGRGQANPSKSKFKHVNFHSGIEAWVVQKRVKKPDGTWTTQFLGSRPTELEAAHLAMHCFSRSRLSDLLRRQPVAAQRSRTRQPRTKKRNPSSLVRRFRVLWRIFQSAEPGDLRDMIDRPPS